MEFGDTTSVAWIPSSQKQMFHSKHGLLSISQYVHHSDAITLSRLDSRMGSPQIIHQQKRGRQRSHLPVRYSLLFVLSVQHRTAFAARCILKSDAKIWREGIKVSGCNWWVCESEWKFAVQNDEETGWKSAIWIIDEQWRGSSCFSKLEYIESVDCGHWFRPFVVSNLGQPQQRSSALVRFWWDSKWRQQTGNGDGDWRLSLQGQEWDGGSDCLGIWIHRCVRCEGVQDIVQQTVWRQWGTDLHGIERETDEGHLCWRQPYALRIQHQIWCGQHSRAQRGEFEEWGSQCAQDSQIWSADIWIGRLGPSHSYLQLENVRTAVYPQGTQGRDHWPGLSSDKEFTGYIVKGRTHFNVFAVLIVVLIGRGGGFVICPTSILLPICLIQFVMRKNYSVSGKIVIIRMIGTTWFNVQLPFWSVLHWHSEVNQPNEHIALRNRSAPQADPVLVWRSVRSKDKRSSMSLLIIGWSPLARSASSLFHRAKGSSHVMNAPKPRKEWGGGKVNGSMLETESVQFASVF